MKERLRDWYKYEALLKSMIEKIIQKTPYVFDVSIWELLWASWYGACLVITKPEGHKDMHYMLDLINKEAITVIHFVPSMLSVFENALKTIIYSTKHTSISKMNLNQIPPTSTFLKIKNIKYIFILLYIKFL